MPTDLLVLLSPTNILIFILILTRLSGLMISAPFFSTYPIPTQVKIWLVAIISFLIFPVLQSKISIMGLHSIPQLVLIMLNEFAIGFLLGFLANILFVAMQIAGEVISLQMGFTISSVLDPVTKTNVPLIGQYYLYFVSFLFLGLNAHLALFSAVYQSFIAIKPAYSFSFSVQFIDNIVHIMTQMFHIAFGMIFPIFGVLFAAEVLLGFVSKLMPQMNVFVISIPIKLYIGVLLILMFLIPCKDYMIDIIQKHMFTLINLFAGGG